jgi:hypothetical protein
MRLETCNDYGSIATDPGSSVEYLTKLVWRTPEIQARIKGRNGTQGPTDKQGSVSQVRVLNKSFRVTRPVYA